MYQALFHKIHVSGANLLIIKLKDLLEKIKNPSAYERKGICEQRKWEYFKEASRERELAQYYGEYTNVNDIRLVYDFTLSGLMPIQRNGITVLADTSSKYYNVVNNHRVTTDTPAVYKNSVYIFGHCNAVGCFAEDRLTIASQLQRKFNEAAPDEIRVVNAANWQKFEDICRQIISPVYEFNRHDFIVILSDDVIQSKCDSVLKMFQDKSFYTYYDLSSVFQRPHDYGEILFDRSHMTHRGYTILAEHIFSILAKLKKNVKNRQPRIPQEIVPYINYLSMLKKKRRSQDEVVGSIVMNCNPFTLGHKYLVEEAIKRCNYLYIFILDEDKSFFKFDDRIKMVKIGLQNIKNTSIVPSGKVIISSETMPEYFSKDTIREVIIDTSYDLSLFALIIAPALNIAKRFAGSEPFCQITRQYNDGMRSILPQYGIEFVELPRLEIGGFKVSASLVRKYIKNNDHGKIKELVPPTTYDFLLANKYITLKI